MKKELFATLLLLTLCVLSLLNIVFLHSFTNSMIADISISQALYADGDALNAEQHLLDAHSLWQESDIYTHILLRHSEVDVINDCFYDILSTISQTESCSAEHDYKKLISRLEGLYKMEQLRLGSIF